MLSRRPGETHRCGTSNVRNQNTASAWERSHPRLKENWSFGSGGQSAWLGLAGLCELYSPSPCARIGAQQRQPAAARNHYQLTGGIGMVWRMVMSETRALTWSATASRCQEPKSWHIIYYTIELRESVVEFTTEWQPSGWAGSDNNTTLQLHAIDHAQSETP